MGIGTLRHFFLRQRVDGEMRDRLRDFPFRQSLQSEFRDLNTENALEKWWDNRETRKSFHRKFVYKKYVTGQE